MTFKSYKSTPTPFFAILPNSSGSPKDIAVNVIKSIQKQQKNRQTIAYRIARQFVIAWSTCWSWIPDTSTYLRSNGGTLCQLQGNNVVRWTCRPKYTNSKILIMLSVWKSPITDLPDPPDEIQCLLTEKLQSASIFFLTFEVSTRLCQWLPWKPKMQQSEEVFQILE